uniref:Protein IDA-LIKE 2-like n=1 Tax=Nicotiana sylvestris TaxID=4096 RepID=A0A1U7YBX8_NICSY|nr:PREDICTED: protein IDA-LIKE 2-like [Nicotiana sylvestris]
MLKRFKNTTILVLLLSLHLLLIFVADYHHANATKNSQLFNVKPLPNSHNNSPHTSFSQSLPKGIPIPPSAPSKRHNGINL